MRGRRPGSLDPDVPGRGIVTDDIVPRPPRSTAAAATRSRRTWPPPTTPWRGGRRRHPPHARLRLGHQGDHPPLRRRGLCGAVPEPLLPRGPGRRPGRRRRGRPRAGRVPDDRLVGDVGAAVDLLRSLGAAKIGTIGYCSGGRQSVLAACSLPSTPPSTATARSSSATPRRVFPVRPMTGIEPCCLTSLSCPLLGLFGAEDKYPSPADVARLDELLDRHGKDFTPVTLRRRGPRLLLRRPAVLPPRRPRTTGGNASRPSSAATWPS